MADLDDGGWILRRLRRGRLWLAPAAGAAVAAITVVVALLVDRYLVTTDSSVALFRGSADTARTLLSVTATSVATFTALVLTILAVVLQLASDRYSHRALRTYLRDAEAHLFLFVHAGTFTYALVALLFLDVTIEGGDTVVGVTIPLALVGALVALAVFVHTIDHMLHASRGTAIIARIADTTRAEIDEQYPDVHDPDAPSPTAPPDDEPTATVPAPRAGVIDEIDLDGLVAWAADRDAVVVLAARVGDFLPAETPLLGVHGAAASDRDAADLAGMVRLDDEPTITGDVAFGFRLLVDIAESAISPAVNDPMTAVQCIDHLHDLLRRLAGRALVRPWARDPDGTERVHVRARDWADHVRLAGDELRLYGAKDLLVVRRLDAMWRDLLEVVPTDRQPALRDQLDRLEEAAARELPADLQDWRRTSTDGVEDADPDA